MSFIIWVSFPIFYVSRLKYQYNGKISPSYEKRDWQTRGTICWIVEESGDNFDLEYCDDRISVFCIVCGHTENTEQAFWRFYQQQRKRRNNLLRSVKILLFCLPSGWFNSKMNRLFGRAKPKEPPPSITDCIAGVRQSIIIHIANIRIP